jgi:hypothetical protein
VVAPLQYSAETTLSRSGNRPRQITTSWAILVFISGFEIETEKTVHALRLRLPVGEIVTTCKSRPEESVSKLRTYTDGTKVIRATFHVLREERPLLFFVVLSAILQKIALVLAYPVVMKFLPDWTRGALSHRDSGNGYLASGRTECGVCFHARRRHARAQDSRNADLPECASMGRSGKSRFVVIAGANH